MNNIFNHMHQFDAEAGALPRLKKGASWKWMMIKKTPAAAKSNPYTTRNSVHLLPTPLKPQMLTTIFTQE
jgi:hypothetical protein